MFVMKLNAKPLLNVDMRNDWDISTSVEDSVVAESS